MAVHADNLMVLISEALEAVGFTVPETNRHTDDIIDKVIGYPYWRGIGRLTVAGNKRTLLHGAFKEQAIAKWVSADVVRALVGFWLLAALLR